MSIFSKKIYVAPYGWLDEDEAYEIMKIRANTQSQLDSLEHQFKMLDYNFR